MNLLFFGICLAYHSKESGCKQSFLCIYIGNIDSKTDFAEVPGFDAFPGGVLRTDTGGKGRKEAGADRRSSFFIQL